VPLISGSEVITCDNTDFIYTGKDADRSGVMFSVPFYAPDGKIKGLITAIILTSALRDLLPASHFALINPGYSYTNLAAGTQQMMSSHNSILAAKPDSSLIYSEIVPVSVHDSRSPWYVWAGLPNDAFYRSPAALSVDNTRQSNFLIVIIIGIGVGVSLFFISRHLDQSRALNLTLTKSRDLAEKSEAEALASATMFKEMNQDITRLNMELSHTAKELREAQSDLIRKAKLEQMGNLVATVAHELRNPLGVVRNSSFALQKKLRDAGINESVSLARIESGIVRCDKIISQFLDFAHSQSLMMSDVDMDAWLEKIVGKAATNYPEFISITCKLGLPGVRVGIDSEKMERVIGNLLSNAADAMTLKDQPRLDRRGHLPHIIITSSLSPRGIEILIGDNGPGIPSDIVEKIREPLFTTKGFGTGLGIPAAEKILELHNGGLEISSVLDEGTSFVIWLPTIRMKSKAA
jgi:signal transduction histidine kinase